MTGYKKLSFEEIYEKYRKGELIECVNCISTGIDQELDSCPECDGLGFLKVKTY